MFKKWENVRRKVSQPLIFPIALFFLLLNVDNFLTLSFELQLLVSFFDEESSWKVDFIGGFVHKGIFYFCVEFTWNVTF